MCAKIPNVLTEAQSAERGLGPAHPQHPRHAEIYNVDTGEVLDPTVYMESLRNSGSRDAGVAALAELAEIEL